MYAVIETSGRQYRVELGSEIELDQLDAEPGSTIELGRVLLVADGDDAHIGQPVVEGARVTGEVVRQDRGEKIVVFKYRPKARRRVKHGHRADLTVVRVSDIVLNGKSAASDAEAKARQEAEERRAAEREAERRAAADRALADKLAAEETAAAADAGEEAPAKPARKPPARQRTTGSKATDATPAKAAPAKPRATRSSAAKGAAKPAARNKKDE